MKAIYLVPGPDGGIYEYRDVEKPNPGENQVLVKIHAAGVNRGELLFVGMFRSDNPNVKPTPAGIDFAGEIVEVGAGVSDWKVGDRVMGRNFGSYAEFSVASTAVLIRIPDTMTYEQAAAVPNAYITAHDALISIAGMEKGDNVIVTAASSAVGIASLQLAKMFGADKIIATTRDADKAQRLLEIGATDVINTSEPDYAKKVQKITGDEYGADVIIDMVGGALLAENVFAMALQGRLVSVGRNSEGAGTVDMTELATRRGHLIGATFRTRTPEESMQAFKLFVEQCTPGLESGALVGVVDKAFPLQDLNDAHQYMLSNSQVGKIILTI